MIYDRIVEEINNRITHSTDLHYKNEFRDLLSTLNLKEQDFVGNYFTKLEWNVGSVRVLKILQDSRILTASNFILRQDSALNIQLILNDLLETEFSLLANLIVRAQFDPFNSIKITAIVEECFVNLLKDLIENPNAININFLTELKPFLIDESLQVVKDQLLDILLEIEKFSWSDAIKFIPKWKIKSDLQGNFFWKILEEIVSDKNQTIEKILCKIQMKNFKGWKFAIIILQIASQNCPGECITLVKKKLKEIFKQFLIKKDEILFYEILIIYRALTLCENSAFESYNNWFKTIFTDIKYTISSDDFKYVMFVLGKVTDYETDDLFLLMQTNTAIAAPVHCNEIVLSYKSHCRRKINELQRLKSAENLIESIVINND